MADKKIQDQQSLIKVEISHKTIIFAAAFLIGLWFLVQIKDIIIIFFFSLILLSAFLKPVEWLVNHRIPRVISVILIYLAALTLISVIIGIILPPLVQQSRELGSKLPQTLATVNNFFVFNKIPVEDVSTTIAKQAGQITGNVIRVTTTIFSSLFLTLTTIILTFYLLLDWNKFVLMIASPFSGLQEKRVIDIISKIENGLGRWVRGQLSLSFIVGTMVFIGLTLLSIPYTLPLALIAGILEIIPVVGPVVSSIPAILVGFTISPIIAVAVGAMYIVVQQIENNLIVPVIMSKVVGLQPPIIIIAILIGAKIGGVGGAFLSIPFIVLIRIIVSELLFEQRSVEG